MTDTKNARPRGDIREAGDEQVDETNSHATHAAGIPHARAYAGPPVPGRRLWLIAVLSCPRCGAMHQHRVYEAARLLAGRTVRACPTTGKPYVLSPVQRRKEACR